MLKGCALRPLLDRQPERGVDWGLIPHLREHAVKERLQVVDIYHDTAISGVKDPNTASVCRTRTPRRNGSGPRCGASYRWWRVVAAGKVAPGQACEAVRAVEPQSPEFI